MFVLAQPVTLLFNNVTTAAIITAVNDDASCDVTAFPSNKPPLGIEMVPVGALTAVTLTAGSAGSDPDAFVVEDYQPSKPAAPLVPATPATPAAGAASVAGAGADTVAGTAI